MIDLTREYNLVVSDCGTSLLNFCEGDRNRMNNDFIIRATAKSLINKYYPILIDVLTSAANMSISRTQAHVFKHWWTDDLTELKDKSYHSYLTWVQLNRPRSGPIFNEYMKDKYIYKYNTRKIRDDEYLSVSNELHDLLLKKDINNFWKTWNCKLNVKPKPNLPVNGLLDEKEISDFFADYFETTCSPNSPAAENKLKAVFEEKFNDYIGNILTTKNLFDVEQITKIISFMKLGKSPGIDGITLEHLIHSHYYVFVMITFLCNLMIISGYVPNEFGCGLTYPIPKIPTYKKLLTTSDFRGITLSPIVSKILEKGILENFKSYFHTSDSQFGFKRKLNCSHALFSAQVPKLSCLWTHLGMSWPS